MAALRVWRAGPALATGASVLLAALGEHRETVTELRGDLKVFTALPETQGVCKGNKAELQVPEDILGQRRKCQSISAPLALSGFKWQRSVRYLQFTQFLFRCWSFFGFSPPFTWLFTDFSPEGSFQRKGQTIHLAQLVSSFRVAAHT